MENLKINKLAEQNLSEREMDGVKGGTSGTGSGCCCGCIYRDSGGSGTVDNYYANNKSGLESPTPLCD